MLPLPCPTSSLSPHSVSRFSDCRVPKTHLASVVNTNLWNANHRIVLIWLQDVWSNPFIRLILSWELRLTYYLPVCTQIPDMSAALGPNFCSVFVGWGEKEMGPDTVFFCEPDSPKFSSCVSAQDASPLCGFFNEQLSGLWCISVNDLCRLKVEPWICSCCHPSLSPWSIGRVQDQLVGRISWLLTDKWRDHYSGLQEKSSNVMMEHMNLTVLLC